MDKKIFSERLSKALEGKYTVTKFAEEVLHVSQPLLSTWKSPNNETYPPLDTLCLISKKLNLSIDYLIGNDTPVITEYNSAAYTPFDICVIIRNLYKEDLIKFSRTEVENLDPYADRREYFAIYFPFEKNDVPFLPEMNTTNKRVSDFIEFLYILDTQLKTKTDISVIDYAINGKLEEIKKKNDILIEEPEVPF